MQPTETRTTLVFGASENPERYSYKATQKLQEHGFNVIAVGVNHGKIGQTEILASIPANSNIDTVTLYVRPDRQTAVITEIVALKPRRIIFNPGTENPDFIMLAQEVGIETEIACTLVLLATDRYFK